jgi:hypothetical protein
MPARWSLSQTLSLLADHSTLLLQALIILWGVELEVVRRLKKSRGGDSESPAALIVIVLFLLGASAVIPSIGAAILAGVLGAHAAVVALYGLFCLDE